MDVSSFMTGYFIGLVFGAAIFVWWTYKFGRFLPKQWPFSVRKFAFWANKKEAIAFESRRKQTNTAPAE